MRSLVVALFLLAAAAPAARAQILLEETVVADKALVEPAGGGLVDEIGFDYPLEAVVARFEAPAGTQLRVLYRADGDWVSSGPLATERFELAIDVPRPGEESFVEYRMETRQGASAPTIRVSGYIRVKKLNSG